MATFVLVHGSWHGGWCWRDLAPLLRRDGHEVHTPTLTGCGANVHRLSRDIDLTVHADDVVNLLFYEDLKDVILVGHSYAGLVVAAAAPRVAERLRSLVFLDAYIVPPGGRGFDLWDEARVTAARAALAGTAPWRDPLGPAALGIEDEALARWTAARMTPHPLATYETPLPADTEASAALPRLYIRCAAGPIAHLFAPVEAQVREWGWQVRSLDTGHDAMLTAPAPLAALLLAHAEEVGRGAPA
ncbi:MAG: alpha/beta hydrolase family protein [Alphaproteobacteria bacterium]